MITANEVLNRWDWGNKPDIIEAMKEYAEEVVKECAKRANVRTETFSSPDIWEWTKVVDSQSILSIIKELQ